MTPADLLALADAATPGPWAVYAGFSTRQVRTADERVAIVAETLRAAFQENAEADARLIALAPDLARLCAEMGEALAIGIEDVLLMDSSEGDSSRNIASNLRAALAKLRELEART